MRKNLVAKWSRFAAKNFVHAVKIKSRVHRKKSRRYHQLSAEEREEITK